MKFSGGLMRITATHPEVDVKILLVRPCLASCGDMRPAFRNLGRDRLTKEIACSQRGFKDMTLVSSMLWKRSLSWQPLSCLDIWNCRLLVSMFFSIWRVGVIVRSAS